MRESEKSKKIWKKGGIEYLALKGDGIDIGCADCPILSSVKCFDQKDGDANHITKYINKQFDFVYSSHCLEHMNNPRQVILEWWKLVKIGGYIFFTVPDEDLYEQGVFPSRFNPDHKHTFTISKNKSWSPVSINVNDLAKSLPGGEILSIIQQNNGYDKNMMTFGPRYTQNFFIKIFIKLYYGIKKIFKIKIKLIEKFFLNYQAVDQTIQDDILAQIQCIVRKKK
jgi:SAM-dependent methyltransferase